MCICLLRYSPSKWIQQCGKGSHAKHNSLKVYPHKRIHKVIFRTKQNSHCEPKSLPTKVRWEICWCIKEASLIVLIYFDRRYQRSKRDSANIFWQKVGCEDGIYDLKVFLSVGYHPLVMSLMFLALLGPYIQMYPSLVFHVWIVSNIQESRCMKPDAEEKLNESIFEISSSLAPLSLRM